jgi:hypothetical protein
MDGARSAIRSAQVVAMRQLATLHVTIYVQSVARLGFGLKATTRLIELVLHLIHRKSQFWFMFCRTFEVCWPDSCFKVRWGRKKQRTAHGVMPADEAGTICVVADDSAATSITSCKVAQPLEEA